jgi:hypothetical protein
MRMPIRTALDLCVAGMAAVLGFALDASLLSIFKTHFQRAVSISRYRPVYLRSGRRNRVRC